MIIFKTAPFLRSYMILKLSCEVDTITVILILQMNTEYIKL